MFFMCRIFCLLLTFSIAISSYAKEQGKIECYDRASQVLRSSTSFTFNDTDPSNIRLSQKGNGSYDNYKNVSWEITSIMEMDNNIYRPLASERIIKDKAGRIIKQLKLSYDYDQNIINFTLVTPNINLRKKFPIKGITADGTNVLSMTAKLAQNGNKYFFLLTDLGNLYKINIKYLGTENALFRSKPIKATRIRFIPDMGILDNFLENAIPTSYCWFSNNSYRWLRYEGKEVDRDSKDVVIFLGN